MPLLSEADVAYIAQGIEQGVRTDGRSSTDFRPLEFELGLIAQAAGSARLCLGSTDVLVGVKVELGSPESGAPDHGRLQVAVECSAVASPDYVGRGGERWSAELAKALESSLKGHPGKGGSGVDLSALSIISAKTCWVVHVDALVLNDDGNVLGALSLAARAALATTRIPKVDVVMGEEGDEPEIELNDDSETYERLNMARVPVIISISQVGNRCVVDLSCDEEPCARSTLHVAAGPNGRVCGVTKDGQHGINTSLMQEMLQLAQRLAPSMISQLEQYVAAALLEQG